MTRDHDRAVTDALSTVRRELVWLAIAATKVAMGDRTYSNWGETFDRKANALAAPGLEALDVLARCTGISLAVEEIPPVEGEGQVSHATEH